MTLVLFGLDGASLENVRSAMARSNLPNLARLLKEGSSSQLRSVYPYVTAPAWTSMFSGVNPGKHGIFDMVVVRDGEIHSPNMRNCEVPFLWDYLSWAGKRVLALGIPFIHPAPPINGVFVTGRFVPSLSCYPQNTRTDYDLSGYEYPASSPLQKRTGSREVLVRRVLDDLKKRTDTSLALLDAERWDLVIIVDSLPDEMFHLRYQDLNSIDETFRSLDLWIGKILGRLSEEDLLLVVSDHGFSGVSNVFYFNEWLKSKGYVYEPESASSGIKQAGSRLGIVRRILPFERLKSKSTHPTDSSPKKRPESLDYFTKTSQKSKVTTMGISNLVWVRFNEGYQEGDSTSSSLTRDLDDLKKRGYIGDYFRSGEIYKGRHLKEAPAPLLVEAADGWLIDRREFTNGRLYKRIHRSMGEHRLHGLLVVLGSQLHMNGAAANIYDVTPSVLEWFGLPMPSDLDGRPIIIQQSKPPERVHNARSESSDT